MPEPQPIDAALRRRRLYIDHLASLLQKMDAGQLPMQAMAYRLFARRLRQALAGVPERGARRPPAVLEAQANRYFDQTGRLPGARGLQAQQATEALLGRLRG